MCIKTQWESSLKNTQNWCCWRAHACMHVLYVHAGIPIMDSHPCFYRLKSQHGNLHWTLGCPDVREVINHGEWAGIYWSCYTGHGSGENFTLVITPFWGLLYMQVRESAVRPHDIHVRLHNQSTAKIHLCNRAKPRGQVAMYILHKTRGFLMLYVFYVTTIPYLPCNINRMELYDFYYTAITLTTGYK